MTLKSNDIQSVWVYETNKRATPRDYRAFVVDINGKKTLILYRRLNDIPESAQGREQLAYIYYDWELISRGQQPKKWKVVDKGTYDSLDDTYRKVVDTCLKHQIATWKQKKKDNAIGPWTVGGMADFMFNNNGNLDLLVHRERFMEGGAMY